MFIEKQIGSEMLSYNPITGVFMKFCKRPCRNIPRFGWYIVNSCNSHGYPHVSIDGRKQTCHRLVFAIMGIDIPAGYQVDHINGIKHDLRYANLRITTPSGNMLGHRSNHRSELPRNVTKAGRRYRVEVLFRGQRFRPYFDTVPECVRFLAILNDTKEIKP